MARAAEPDRRVQPRPQGTQDEADQAQETWNLDFPLIADPSCELVKMMNKKGWITSQIEAKVNDHEVVIRVFNDFTYQVAMLQPGVCALRGTDLNNMDVLCTWGSVPTAANIGGASGRPNPKQIVWKAIQKSLIANAQKFAATKGKLYNDKGEYSEEYLNYIKGKVKPSGEQIEEMIIGMKLDNNYDTETINGMLDLQYQGIDWRSIFEVYINAKSGKL